MRANTMSIVAVVGDKQGQLLGRLQHALDLDAASAIPPHIPLIEPFTMEPPFLPMERFCWRAGHASPSFWIELGGLVIDEDAAMAWLPIVSGVEHLAALRATLLDGEHIPAPSAKSYEPRVVAARVGYLDNLAITKYRWESAGPGERRCFVERFALMAQHADGSWYERDFYTLDRAVATA